MSENHTILKKRKVEEEELKNKKVTGFKIRAVQDNKYVIVFPEETITIQYEDGTEKPLAQIVFQNDKLQQILEVVGFHFTNFEGPSMEDVIQEIK